MTDLQHPITPPPERFKQWEDDILNEQENVDLVLDCAWRDGFRAGADQAMKEQGVTNDPQITPPPELFRQWEHLPRSLAFEAAYRAGADAELEACCDSLQELWAPSDWITSLRAKRRPKPPSLKEQAQRILIENGTTLDGRLELDPDDINIIRHALEQLDD